MGNSISDKILRLMGKPTNIRNMSVIAHFNHGKSTLTDSLRARTGVISKGEGGTSRADDNRQEERGKGVTVKSTSFRLVGQLKADDEVEDIVGQKSNGKDFLINLIDTPGHIDLTPEVAAALRVTDGALVVIDVVEGVSSQTEILLRQALVERVKPVVMINKVDRGILELEMDKEDLYQSFARIVEAINENIAAFLDKSIGDVQVYAQKGTVAFGSSRHGWAFTIRQFAILYAKKFGVDVEKMMEYLWGDNYFNPHNNQWTTNGQYQGKTLERGFNQFILDPIFKIHKAVMNSNTDEVSTLLSKLEIKLGAEERALEGKPLLEAIMKTWLPTSDSVIEMIIIHLPSPVTAQKYRVETLYDGPQDDEAARAIRDTDPEGPLMLYVSKMVPASDNDRLYAFGRIFSGTVRAGLKVRIQKEDVFIDKKISQTLIMMGGKVESIEDVPAGNIVCLSGIDQFLLTTGTLTTDEAAYQTTRSIHR